MPLEAVPLEAAIARATQGSGWAPYGAASPPWECRAAQSRQARLRKAQGPSSGTTERRGGRRAARAVLLKLRVPLLANLGCHRVGLHLGRATVGGSRDEGRRSLNRRAGGVRTLCEESTGPYCSSDCCAWPHMPLRTSWSVVLQSGSGPFTGSGRLRSGILAVLSGWYLCGARQAGARLPCSGRTRPREGCAL